MRRSRSTPPLLCRSLLLLLALLAMPAAAQVQPPPFVETIEVREVEVLVDHVEPIRAHGHGGDAPTSTDAGVRLSGRTRGNKLVHLAGDPALIGRTVIVRVEHAGPYALRGALVGA